MWEGIGSFIQNTKI